MPQSKTHFFLGGLVIGLALSALAFDLGRDLALSQSSNDSPVVRQLLIHK